MDNLILGILAVALITASLWWAARAYRRGLRVARDDHRRRPALWNRFYAHDWGATTTNNYGFAPAEGDDPQRFQHQMYLEMLAQLEARRPLSPGLKLLEVSCGRGGGLAAFLAKSREMIDATGLDVAASAVKFCRATYGQREGLRFIEGSALDLPFDAASFDVVLNVEASNDYGDRPRFLSEVARVLKPDGVFLYTDTCRAGRREELELDMELAGFAAEFKDITANVVEACRADTPRRRTVMRSEAPLLARLVLGRQLENYAAVEGSKKFAKFESGRRTYLMTAAVKA
ncbi:MAG TPA: class I SAM-dependent methyltransferase [Sphingomicrobium sp.]|nr:class I SAM-dependent methyltransferase [Sphingomicrobium sp.]